MDCEKLLELAIQLQLSEVDSQHDYHSYLPTHVMYNKSTFVLFSAVCPGQVECITETPEKERLVQLNLLVHFMFNEDCLYILCELL